METKKIGTYFVVGCFIAFMLITGCDTKRNPNQRTYESSYSTIAAESPQEKTYVGNSLSTGSSPYSNEQSVEDNPYYNNSLSTGLSPYICNGRSVNDESQISVSISGSSNCDVVVIIKRGGEISRNAYIKTGGSYTFCIPNGTYQVFSYGGKGWNPNNLCQEA